jgi:hypothetical protein
MKPIRELTHAELKHVAGGVDAVPVKTKKIWDEFNKHGSLSAWRTHHEFPNGPEIP